MIEVEKKFHLREDDIERLTTDAEFLHERVFTDTYYDTADLSLGLRDQWLRSRDGRFELKLPVHHGTERMADQYHELDDETSIRAALHLPPTDSFARDLAHNGYLPFCVCTTRRHSYHKEEFTIDLDEVSYGDFTYMLGEIELMVKQPADANAAIEKITAFAEEHSFPLLPVRGKVVEYLRKKRPEHYRTLVNAGVIHNL